MEETRVLVKTTAYHQVTGKFLTCPSWDSNPGSGERQLVVSGNALDHKAIWGHRPQWWETASSQWQCLRPQGNMRPGQWWETASSQWQCLRPQGNMRPGQWWETASSQWQCHRPQGNMRTLTWFIAEHRPFPPSPASRYQASIAKLNPWKPHTP